MTTQYEHARDGKMTPQMQRVAERENLPAETIRQEVAAGELIGKATGFISAHVHASIAGVVQAPSAATLPNAALNSVVLAAGDITLNFMNLGTVALPDGTGIIIEFVHTVRR